ncbi:MAG: FMN-binding protein [Candidatus Lloydbacteria bacterium]|nr:FMN-binding protein [Candidatus Lloydbacteria bacterium]
MKKILLSFSLIFSFIVYTAFQRLGVFGNQSVYTAQESIDRTTNQSGVPSPSVPPKASGTLGGLEDGSGLEREEDDDGFVPRTALTQKTTILSTETTLPSGVPANKQAQTPSPAVSVRKYRDGRYTGPVTDAYYGNVQIAVSVTGGSITDVQFLDYPHDRKNSIRINNYAMPVLKQEAIAAQSAQVDAVSGATATSEAFIQSFAEALAQAK